MADEPAVIQALRVVFEAIWYIIMFNYEVLKAFYRWIIPPAPKDVTDEVVLITGTGHGMGREMALRFARLGSKVVCVDINPKSNEETYNMIKEERGKVYKYECDVTDRAAVFQLAEKVRKDVGDVTILVNNAGIMPCKSVLKQTEKEIRLMMDLNVVASLWTIQAFLPAMIQNNHGHIAAMSSMAGVMGIRNLVPYCGSKHAVRGIMHGLEIELHDDPRVNGIHLTTVYPYIVDTGLCKKPRVRFQSTMQVVSPGEAADQIVDAIRRNYMEITVPSYLYYSYKYIFNPVPIGALKLISDFLDTGVDAHE